MNIQGAGYLLFLSLLLTTAQGADIPSGAENVDQIQPSGEPAKSITAIPIEVSEKTIPEPIGPEQKKTIETLSTPSIAIGPVSVQEKNAPENAMQKTDQQAVKQKSAQAVTKEAVAENQIKPEVPTSATKPTPASVTPKIPTSPTLASGTSAILTTSAALSILPAAPQAVTPVQPEQATEEQTTPVSAGKTTEESVVAPEQKNIAQKNDQQEMKKTAEAQTGTPKEGIDTVDIEEGGNWLLKRKALEDTVDTIEQISRVFTKMIEAAMKLRIKHNQLNNEYDIFLSGIGFDLGDLDKLLNDLLEELERERKREGDLTDEERELITAIGEKKKEIEHLQESLKMLQDLDAKIVDAMMTMEKQVETANTYQNQAWKNFQVIKKVLSDEKAEELYYNTEGLFKSVQASYQYIQGSLSNYFNEQAEALRNQMAVIKTSISSLQANGIDLKKELEKAEQLDQERDQKRIHEQEHQEAKKEKAEAEIKQEKSGFFAGLKNVFNGFIQMIVNALYFVINGIKGLFSKK